jgi:GAF domain-containing protein
MRVVRRQRARKVGDMTAQLPLADELAVVFTRMSGLLLSTETVNTVLTLITSLAREVVPGTVGAGVTLVDSAGGRVSAAATDAVTEHADELQYRMGVGPCLTAWDRRVVVRVDDVTRDDRWPEWGAAVSAEDGVRAVLSAPLLAGGEALGALKVYARAVDAYGEREEILLTMFAAQAAVLVANVRSHEDARRLSDELRDAMRGRDVINMAKGIVMAREHVDEEAAFATLADLARDQRQTVRETATDLYGSTVPRRG